MLGASQFFCALSERQYLKDFGSDRSCMNEALTRALTQWRKLIESGPPTQIAFRAEKKSDAVIFTDGFTPDARFREKGADTVGAVIFDLRNDAPSQFTAVIPNEVRDRWLVRKTQIIPIEMIAPILAVHTFGDQLRGKDLLLLIDSEPAESALVKGSPLKVIFVS